MTQTPPSPPEPGPHGVTDQRPWGFFTVLQDLPHTKVKLIQVNPGHRLSLQLHHQREEHWLVVQGQAEVVIGEETQQVRPGQYVFIPRETPHRIGNRGPEPVQLIEVQLGTYFGEDDIVRLQDDYQR